MKVTPISKTLADVLRGNFLRIPRFQRPYDWDRENLTEFWNDLRDRSDPEYFMGSLVVFGDSKEKNLLSLVDGQQRITTITIMLAIIRNQLASFKEDGPASAIHELIESRDLDNKSRFVLEHDPADRYLQEVIQSRSVNTRRAAETTQQQNLASAYKYLDGVLTAHLRSEFMSEKNASINYLKHLRDCLLQMHFISIELDNEDDAYLIFETLNTRGKDLRPSDLLKNHFMRLIPAKVKGMDAAKNTWSDIIEKLNSVTVAIDTDSFLLHYWLAHKNSVSKANLYLSYKSDIKKSNARSWLDDLKSASSTYVRVMAPGEVKFSREERALKESIQAIRIFGVAQAAPLMLSLMSQYEKKVISLKQVRAVFELIEKFTFQFNALTQSRGGGGVSNMYAKLAQNTIQCSSSQQFAHVASEIKEKFRERLPDEAEFTLPFSRLTYRATYTRDRALVRYALTKLSSHFGMPEETDISLMTVEHLLPQSEGEETYDAFDVGAIGNLILVNDTINGKLAAKGFAEKLNILRQEQNVYIDPLLLSAKKWNFDQIGERGVALAKIGYEKIWNI